VASEASRERSVGGVVLSAPSEMAPASPPPDTATCLMLLLRHIASSPGLGAALDQLGTRLLFSLTDPPVVLSLDCRAGLSHSVESGVEERPDDTVVAMSANHASALFLGVLNAARALRDGDMRVTGPAAEEFIRLTPVIRQYVASTYEALLRESGREDLTIDRQLAGGSATGTAVPEASGVAGVDPYA
jgi:hypothetical protein